MPLSPRVCNVCGRILTFWERLRVWRRGPTTYHGQDAQGVWRDYEVNALCSRCEKRSERQGRG